MNISLRQIYSRLSLNLSQLVNCSNLGCLQRSSTNFFLPQSNLVTVSNQTFENGFFKTKPFPYKTKSYTKLHVMFPFLDPTDVRINKNSKIITVEGNIGSKKEEFCKSMADAFGLHYMPEPKIEEIFINPYGFDYRTLNQYIHPKLWAIDEKLYYENPHHPAVSWLKIYFYKIRYLQYLDALTHLFNTGEGIVLERSPFTDFVFADAMYKCGFLPKDVYDFYFRLRFDTIHHLKRPQLIIYLDTDVDLCLKRIKERGIEHEVKSKVLSKQYLQEIENSYKNLYLEEANKYSEIAVFKWNNVNSMKDIVNDISKINLDEWDMNEDKFCDWNYYFIEALHENRYDYTNKKSLMLESFNDLGMEDIESLCCEFDDIGHRNEVYESMASILVKLDAIFKLILSFQNLGAKL
ncbi:NADH dehydrogenase [ubiquinone] 1 alpha subcomplex subunit 10 [Sarcoptes scabiei]|uniref:NADH dehydrogenase [ubiquinone] 1 alpha subcomplex subunit 10, mitochondrial n=1 Tax=Sarcoptes scabiei TaxID=52283 RepID=A0A834R3D3_SARSC|nr:NADH dehydrogenase [ubiquinone] 1 alpha subcomplex subunit 10 [Sarcoptes scabiei]